MTNYVHNGFEAKTLLKEMLTYSASSLVLDAIELRTHVRDQYIFTALYNPEKDAFDLSNENGQKTGEVKSC